MPFSAPDLAVEAGAGGWGRTGRYPEASPRLDQEPFHVHPSGSLMTPMDFPRLPESSMPQVQPPEEGQRPQAGDKLANGVGTNKLAWDLASRLYRLEGFRKSEVAAHLS